MQFFALTRASAVFGITTAAALLASPIAMAQQQTESTTTKEAEEIGEVVITGYRASLQGALDIKRNSDLVVDAIAGGDIGALPDVTIAESLVRLPGVNEIGRAHV